MSSQAIGGGAKKILYTLQAIRQIGPVKASKALTSHNTCKACALGMGGQQGGMVNELGEFPSVCNKSVQAQSTDIQPAIPDELFTHSLAEFRDLSPRELEKIGRLNTPLHKPRGVDHFQPIDWDAALGIAAERFGAAAPERTFFYSSGRSSNEAGFLFQLLARAYGTNNVTNCSYYCHQATGVGLNATIGTGTATVELADLGRADLIFVIGANPASNHPRFIHQLKACRDRGGQVVVINPAKEPGLVKFALPKSPKSLIRGGSEIASEYLQPKIGGDMAVLKGLAKAILEDGAEASGFIDQHTEGFDAYRTDLNALGWGTIEAQSGITRVELTRISRLYSTATSPVFAWGMGITHHQNGSENVEAIAALALLCGAIGRPGAGLLPLRGHSNVQGVGTIGVKPVLADEVISKMEAAFNITLPNSKGLDTIASVQAAGRGKIDAALLMGGNLLAANPDTQWAEAALNKIGFRLALTTTLNTSHVNGVDDGELIILPVTARDEEWEPTTQESMFNYVRLSDGGISRLGNVRPESVILADLATRLLPDSPIDFATFKRHARTREVIAEIVPGMEKLASIDDAKAEFHISNRLLHAPEFKTSSGRAQFKVTPLPEPATTAPFRLSTIRSEGQFNSIIYEEKDSYRGTTTRWSVLISQDDFDALGLRPGGTVNIRSDSGEMRSVIAHVFDLPKGNVMAYYPEANVLTGQAVDPRSRTPAFKSCGVWIEAAPPE